jgi:hypothetical protein
VGSCTDLVATVVQPLKDLYGERFEVGPYPVLFKPSQGIRILKSATDAGFSPKAAYIFRKQLEEADAIVINRIDELDTSTLAELTGLVQASYPGTPILRMSAKTGQGFDALTELLDQRGNFGRKILDIDYDTYAEGEAELGWLNTSIRVTGKRPFALDALLLDLVRHLQDALVKQGGEVAHLKAIGLSEVSFGVANLVSSQSRPELSLPARGEVSELDLIVNARVALEPERIAEQVRQTVSEVCAARSATAAIQNMQSFRPGRPQPTHRYATAK